MSNAEVDHLADIDPTAGALHCLQLNGRYLVRVEERQGFDDQIGYVLVPIRNLSRELIPLLRNGDKPITRSDFITSYRDFQSGDSDSLAKSKIFDVLINKKEIVEAIFQVLDEGRGLVLVSEDQIRNGDGVTAYDGKLSGNYLNPIVAETIEVDEKVRVAWNKRPDQLIADGIRIKSNQANSEFNYRPPLIHEVVPIDIYYKGDKRDAVASFECRDLLLSRIGAEPTESVENQVENLYQKVKRCVFAIESFGNRDEYRITQKDLALLGKYADRKLVKELERSIVINRLSTLIVKALRGVDEGVMVSAGKFTDPNVANAFRLISILGLIITNGLQKHFEKDAVKSVSESLGKVLQNILVKHQKDIIAYIIGRSLSEDEASPEVYFSNRASIIARDLGKAEEISPFIEEMIPGQIAVNGVLFLNNDYLPMLINAFMVGGTWVAMRLAKSQVGSKTIRLIRSLLTDLGASVITDASAVAGSLMPLVMTDVNQGALLLTSIALTGKHSSDQIGGTDEINDGKEALSELREFLKWMNMSLSTEELKSEHSLRILATEDAGPVSVSNWTLFEKGVLRYQMLDAEEAKIPKSHYSEENKIYPSMLVKNFTARTGNTVVLENQDMYLRFGHIVHLISPESSGKTVILKSLADEIDHPTGTLLLRQPETDYNVHGESGRGLVRYFDCSGRSEKLPDFFSEKSPLIAEYQEAWKKDLTEREKAVFEKVLSYRHLSHLEEAQALVAYFKEYKLFTDEEILAFLNNEIVSRTVRSRLWVATAGWGNARVVLLDDPFANDQSKYEWGRYKGSLGHLIDALDGKAEDSDIDISIDVMCEVLGIDKELQKDQKVKLLRSINDLVKPTADLCNFILSRCSYFGEKLVIVTSNKDENTSSYMGIYKSWYSDMEIYKIKDRKLEKVELIRES